jgi:predicted chitinase
VRSRDQQRGRLPRTVVVLVATTMFFGGVSASAAGAQTPPQTPTTSAQPQVQPPDTNTFPIPAPVEVSFTDSWHACRDGCSRQHKGNDLLADEGSPVVAVESGTIVKVNNVDEGLGGLTVWLRGDSGVSYYYAHNSENLVAVGDVVNRGQVIARVGRTGNARNTEAHVHFQINLCGTLSSDEPCTVDPYPYLQRWAQGLVGGGADGVAWYQPATANWGRRSDTGSELTPVAFGPAGARDVLPLAGDWNGDARDSVGLYQRSDATFHLLDDQGVEMAPIAFGTPGRSDVWPIAGDFDGDGLDTIGFYQQSDATFQIMVDGGVRSAPFALGTAWRADALPVVGDWDGDGRDSLGVYQQADTTLVLVDDEGRAVDPTTVALPVERPEGATAYDAFPAAGDWDGDGRDAIGILWRDAATMELPVPSLDDPAASVAVTTDEVPDMFPVAGDWNGNDLVTIEDLRQIFGPLPDEAKVVEGLPAINAAMMRAGIFTPARKAAFLATLRNESGFRYDAVEVGNERRYRGRGLIQLTGEGNYRNAGQFLGVDLVANPDLALNGMVSPAVAAWYWTVARNINMAADQLDMAAVNIAIGFAPSMRRDMMRCADFIAGLRYYSGGAIPEGVNCARTDASRRLAFTAIVAPATGGRLLPGLPQAPSAPAAGVAPDLSSVPPEWTAPTTSPAPAPVTPTTPPPTAPGTTQPPTSEPPPTDPGSTTPPTDGGTSSTTEPPTTSSPTSEPSTSSSTTESSTSETSTTATGSTTSTVVPDSTSSTTLFESQYD